MLAQPRVEPFHDDARLHPDAPRLMILQFWRNLGPAKMDLPLAFCDARGVSKDQTRAFPVTSWRRWA